VVPGRVGVCHAALVRHDFRCPGPFMALSPGWLLIMLTAPLVAGCTVLGASLGSVGGAAIGGSAGAAAKAGTDYELTGAVARTFSVPLSELRQATLATGEQLDIALQDEPGDSARTALIGYVSHRTVQIRFEAITNVLTRVTVAVNRSFLRKDPATAAEIIAQLNATVEATGVSTGSARRRVQ
jgi:hypothetical protein